MSPRTGRPKVDNPMNERLYVRVSKQEKDEIMKFSSESGYSILELIRAGIEKLKGQKIRSCHATNENNFLSTEITLCEIFYHREYLFSRKN